MRVITQQCRWASAAAYIASCCNPWVYFSLCYTRVIFCLKEKTNRMHLQQHRYDNQNRFLQSNLYLQAKAKEYILRLPSVKWWRIGYHGALTVPWKVHFLLLFVAICCYFLQTLTEALWACLRKIRWSWSAWWVTTTFKVTFSLFNLWLCQ